jgi:beta-N-acetylhexosaminidase
MLAAGKDLGKIAEAGAFTGDLLRLLGINLNLAPVLDLDRFPDDPRASRGRCWSRDPQRVIDYAGLWNRWLRKRHIAGCAKHFPAGGRAVAESNHGFPTSPATLEELLREDVIPYTALMPELDAVMTGHVVFPNIDPDFPASLSPRIVRRFLREQLGFDSHLVLTDDLDIETIGARYGRGEDVRLAISAGNDLAMIRHHARDRGSRRPRHRRTAALDDRRGARPGRAVPPQETPPARDVDGQELAILLRGPG